MDKLFLSSGKKILWAYAFTTAILIGSLWAVLGTSSVFVVYSVAGSIVLLISFTDVIDYRVPNEAVVIFAFSGILLLPFNPLVNMMSVLLGVVVIGGGMYILSILTKGQVGLGDAKLMAAMGIYFGINGSFLMFMYALIIGGIVGLFLVTFRKVTKKTTIPFIPFIFLGIILELITKF